MHAVYRPAGAGLGVPGVYRVGMVQEGIYTTLCTFGKGAQKRVPLPQPSPLPPWAQGPGTSAGGSEEWVPRVPGGGGLPPPPDLHLHAGFGLKYRFICAESSRRPWRLEVLLSCSVGGPSRRDTPGRIRQSGMDGILTIHPSRPSSLRARRGRPWAHRPRTFRNTIGITLSLSNLSSVLPGRAE